MLALSIDGTSQRIVTDTTLGANSSVNAGLAYTSAGKLFIDIANTPTSYANGVPMKAGAVCVADGGTIAKTQNGLPLTSTGRLCVAISGTTARLQSNIPYDTNNRIVME